MTEVVHSHDAHHAPAPPRRGLQRVTRPGFIRAAFVTPLFWAIGAGIVIFFRWLGHYEPLWDWPVITVVAFLTAAHSPSSLRRTRRRERGSSRPS